MNGSFIFCSIAVNILSAACNGTIARKQEVALVSNDIHVIPARTYIDGNKDRKARQGKTSHRAIYIHFSMAQPFQAQ